MPILFTDRPTALKALYLLTIGQLVLGATLLPAQGLTVGGLTAVIVDDRGAPVREASVTLERGGAAVRTITATLGGIASAAVLTPGRYAVLAEQFGYQPVRMRDVDVLGGGMTRITIRLQRRPPPITDVEEQVSNATTTGAPAGRTLSGRAISEFAARHDISGVPAAFADVDAPRDGRSGFLTSGNGLRPGYSSLFVDGVHEALLRHPGLPGDPASAPVFARDGVDQVTVAEFGSDGPGPGTLGSILGARSSHGGEGFTFRPWATFSSAKLGGRTEDNPGDSAATSIQAGVAMGGSIKADTASWFIRADYQQLQQPTASPFDASRTTADSGADLLGSIRTAAQALGHQDVSSWLAPTVRTWKGGSGSGRLDWRFGPSTLLALRAGGASWSEASPQAGTELANGAGAKLTAKDLSVAAALTTGSDAWTSETRIGLRSATRDWTGASLPFSSIVGDALAFGGAGTLPGNFKDAGFSASEGATYRAGDHTFGGGFSFDHRTVTYDWLPGSAGRFEFGDLASFAAGRGAFYQALRSVPAPDLGVTDVGGFLRDNWRVTPEVEVFGGIRIDFEGLPATVLAASASWRRVSGVQTNIVPPDVKKQDIGVAGGFSWDVSGTGRTVVRGSAGLVPGQYDVVALAEAAQYDGDVSVRRATGTLTWPQVGANAGRSAGQALTFFDSGLVRKPKSFKADLALAQRLGQATTLTISGGYRHADYLLQRQDLNLVGAPVTVGSDGRSIFGSLEQFGGLLTPKVGTNRRFGEFDMVYALTSSGFNDYYEASLSVDRHVAHGVDLSVGYTYSRTTDNLPGELSADPANRVTPFPGGLNGVRWENGTSDLDIPNRVSATLRYTTSAKSSATIAARYRYRSGLPFTPGFRDGVDANGDGAGGNDPAFIATLTPGMDALTGANPCLASQVGHFAARNSCREGGVHAVDLHASLPIARGWAITVDGFNLVGSTTGVFDHAAVLVDPKGTITIDASGHTVLPLVANPGFGQLLSRRGDPRVLRVGFRVEN